jgi:protoporphyrinogen oxidase
MGVSVEVAVVGAGPAGLMAGWRAAAAGRSVVIVDGAPAVGGMAASFEVAGVRVDHGSHRLHPSTPPHVLGALRDLLGHDLQERPRNGRIRLARRWLRFPLSTVDLVRNLPPAMAARMAADAAAAPLRRPRADTYAEVVRAGLGPTASRVFHEPYARKLWGVDPSELAGELARRRVSASSPSDIARRLVRGTRTFLYPRRGFGQIPEALADAAVRAGADLRLEAPVAGVAGGAVTLAGGERIDAAHVVWTAPVTALATAAGAPADVAERAARLEHRGLVLVYLALAQRRWTTFDAHYFPELDIPMSRLSEPRNYRDGDDPPDRTVLCAELPATAGDERWTAADADLADLVVRSLAAAGLPPVRPVEVVVRRLPRVYPVYRRSTAWDLAAVHLWASGLPGVRVLGRQGLFVPDNTHHVLAMGWDAAGTLADEEAWDAAVAGSRANVVED